MFEKLNEFGSPNFKSEILKYISTITVVRKTKILKSIKF